MVAEESHHLAVALARADLEIGEELVGGHRVGAPVDVISDEDEVVVGLGIDEVDHVLQGIEATVDVADGQSSHGSTEA